MFEYNYKITMADTDAAGVLFFANQFKIIHEAYESLLDVIGYSIKIIITKEEFLLPIIHAESDFTGAVRLSDQLTIEISLEKTGDRSFSLNYNLLNQKGDSIGTANTVHVAIDKESFKKTELPENFIEGLKEICG